MRMANPQSAGRAYDPLDAVIYLVRLHPMCFHFDTLPAM